MEVLWEQKCFVWIFHLKFAYDISCSDDDMQMETSEGITFYSSLYVLRSWTHFKKLQKKDLDLEEETAKVKSLVDRGWTLEGIAVE